MPPFDVNATTGRPAGARKRGFSARRRLLRRAPLWLLLPALVATLAVHFAAPAIGAWYSFTDWAGFGKATWVGLGNYKEAFSDPVTRGAIYHTLLLAVAFVVLVNVIGLALAVGLNRTVKSRILLRTVFFAPFVASPLAVSYIWQFIFTYNGALNTFLRTLGLSSWTRPWLGDPSWALWTILVALVWQFSGLTMVVYLAGLQSIPDELYEAAAVDGAPAWFVFRRVTFPLLAPACTIAASLTTIFGLRVFDQVLGMTGGGPDYATETLATQIWTETFTLGRFGYGASLAVILTVLVAVVAITQLVLLRRREAHV